MATLLVNGILGLAMCITTLYYMGDLDAAMKENPRYPLMAIFRNVVKSTAGATVMSVVVIVMIFVASTGALTSTSREFRALSQGHALPVWAFLKRTSLRTNIPRNAVATVAIVACLLSLINMGDATAFHGVCSISIAGLNGSYLVAASLLLRRHLTSGTRTPHCEMNWAVVVALAVLGFSVVHYFVYARKVYKAQSLKYKQPSYSPSSVLAYSWGPRPTSNGD
jgi:choline transport protein